MRGKRQHHHQQQLASTRLADFRPANVMDRETRKGKAKRHPEKKHKHTEQTVTIDRLHYTGKPVTGCNGHHYCVTAKE